MNIRHALTDNIGVKIIALVVAVFIWFNASGQQQMVRLRTVPLVVENLPDSLTVTGTIPAIVELRVSGTRRQLLTMGFRRVHGFIDLTGSRPGRQRISLSASNVRVPNGIDRRNVNVLSPAFVDLQLERLVTRRVQASLTTSGSIDPTLVLRDDGYVIAPSWITVRGPESTIARLRTVPTRPLDLTKVKDTSEREVPLDFDPTLIACDPPRVLVTVLVAARGQRVLANIPPTVFVDAEDIEAVVLPSAVSLTLEGPAPMLDTLSSGDVSVLLNLSGYNPGQYTLAPEVIKPHGVELVGMSADSLTVRLSRREPPKSGKK